MILLHTFMLELNELNHILYPMMMLIYKNINIAPT